MKRFYIYSIVWLILGSGLIADSVDRDVNVFGAVALNVSDIRGFSLDLGAEMQLSENVFGQILLDYYFDPFKEEVNGVKDSAYGINFYGVYKMPITQRLNWFIKAGVHYTTLKSRATALGYSVSVRRSDFGICGGGGVEYKLYDRLAIYGGGTIKFLFADGDTGNWFKFTVGLAYQAK